MRARVDDCNHVSLEPESHADNALLEMWAKMSAYKSGACSECGEELRLVSVTIGFQPMERADDGGQDVAEGEMTAREAYGNLLTNLDEAYDKIRAYHADPEALNREGRDYERAKEEFKWAEQYLFMFKQGWAIARGK